MGSRLTRPLLPLAQPLLLPVRARDARRRNVRRRRHHHLSGGRIRHSLGLDLLPPHTGASFSAGSRRRWCREVRRARRPRRDVVDLRDDTSGLELGNKVRKLEFLMAEALAGGDRVATIGGLEQPLPRDGGGGGAPRRRRPPDPALPGVIADGDSGSAATLLDRLPGATLHTRTVGSTSAEPGLTAALAEQLRAQGKKPYVIPQA